MASTPSRSVNSALRQLINRLCPVDADLKAFCLDMFPEIYERIPSSMDKVLQVNLILEQCEPTVLLQALRDYKPYECATNAKFLPENLRAYAQASHFLSKKNQYCEMLTGYINIFSDRGANMDCVLMKLSEYPTFLSLLSDLYNHYLREKYPPYSYGRNWVLTKEGEWDTHLVLLPWSWLLSGQMDRVWLSGNTPEQCGIYPMSSVTIVDLPNDYITGVAMRQKRLFDMILRPTMFFGGSCGDVSRLVFNQMIKSDKATFNAEKYPFQAILHMPLGPRRGNELFVQSDDDELEPTLQRYLAYARSR